jgi:fatty acid desaturase
MRNEETTPLRADPELKSRLREFLVLDNTTNWRHLARVHLVILVTFAVALGFFAWTRAQGLALVWNLPVYVVALLVMGASQHQLAGAGHEAVHHTLFRNRWLNELAGDWLCMFPIVSSVHQFRLYHFAHHQHVNDPDRDPDFAMLKASGHWMRFPVGKAEFLGRMLRQILLFDLVRYMLVRLRFNSLGEYQPGTGPRDQPGKAPARLALGLFLAIVAALVVLQGRVSPWVVGVVPLAAWGMTAAVYATVPESWFGGSPVRRVVPARQSYIGQTAFFSFLLAGLAYIQNATGFLALRYYTLLWYVPLVTTFPVFLILRQLVQHGNGDRGWLTNTRVFRMNPLVRYAVFPFGMDYHLPHHMYASVPHYRLAALHEFLLTKPDYADSCQVVDNYFIPRRGHPRNPTVLEVLGPGHERSGGERFLDAAMDSGSGIAESS